jgi:hypothetical protein
MPHVSDVRATSPDHDRHDLVLVAALAAGDLAATDRDHALAQTRTCPACGELHDDLLAIAHATASVPPMATRPRDFRLTPADAARLRPAGWRAVLGRLTSAPRAVTRPLGAGLATIGLVGLLIGNAPAIIPSGAASPASISGAGGATAEDAAGSPATGADRPGVAPVSVPAASNAPQVAASAAASSRAEFTTSGGPTGSNDGRAGQDLGVTPGASAGPVAAGPAAGGPKSAASPARDLLNGSAGPQDSSLRPMNVLFGAAVLVGIGLLILSRRRGREPV